MAAKGDDARAAPSIGRRRDDRAAAAPPRRTVPTPNRSPTPPQVAGAAPRGPSTSGDDRCVRARSSRARFAKRELNEAEAENIALKYLLSAGSATGREAAEQMKLPFKLVDEIAVPAEDRSTGRLSRLGDRRRLPLPAHRHGPREGPPPGRALHLLRLRAGPSARLHRERRQAIAHEAASDAPKTCTAAFDDLLINKKMLRRLGPAINSGRGMFLFGAPGNGKTSIAERITRPFGDTIWIPRAIGVDGEIIRLFDPSNHEEVPLDKAEGLLDNAARSTAAGFAFAGRRSSSAAN